MIVMNLKRAQGWVSDFGNLTITGGHVKNRKFEEEAKEKKEHIQKRDGELSKK